MNLSARNQLRGVVQAVKSGTVMAEVTVTLTGGERFVSVITAESARQLGLTVGSSVVVVIKATDVMLATEP